MKKIILVLVDGKEVEYGFHNLSDVEGTYNSIIRMIKDKKRFVIIKTKDGKLKTAYNVENIISIAIQYE